MLSTKQQVFVEEYLRSLNATEAARRAGYSAKTARSIGSENLTKPDTLRTRENLAKLSVLGAPDILKKLKLSARRKT